MCLQANYIPTYDRIVLYDADDSISIQAQPGQDIQPDRVFCVYKMLKKRRYV